MNIPFRVRIACEQASNRTLDTLAVLLGYCNDRSVNSGVPGDGGGYLHWRCALRRGHEGLHRYRNYVWNEQRDVEYAPVALADRMPSQPWDRRCIGTRRQFRQAIEWHKIQDEKRAALRAERRRAR
ncbi:hypothetical protein [Streptomyces sp. NBC_00038]|uniref:hypothetical protein n=1 Tax=Streptomyces sp. NBC_00038 TaxID=2903615 RepID=UPI002258A6BF|nr:hypothetical protein [Streptomyces sp. NBC_00038]MCX5562745.1 hypothetical protein [Streptomyces sp. NBC_00038]MCX5563605.1 hypothetical protein [Streptomyces sp. NBC_00038]